MSIQNDTGEAARPRTAPGGAGRSMQGVGGQLSQDQFQQIVTALDGAREAAVHRNAVLLEVLKHRNARVEALEQDLEDLRRDHEFEMSRALAKSEALAKMVDKLDAQATLWRIKVKVLEEKLRAARD